MYRNLRVTGVMLVGGAGTRLWPIVEYGIQSKATIKLAGKRLAYFNADRLQEAGVKRLVLPVQYNAEEIKRKLKFGYHNFDKIEFTQADPRYFPGDEQSRFRGTADAVMQSKEYLKDSDFLIIVPCDHVTNIDFRELLNRAVFNWETYKAVMTTAAVEKPEEEIMNSLGNPKIDADGKVIEWIEKPVAPISNLAALGIYAGPTKEILEAIEIGGHDFGKHVLKYLRGKGLLYAHFYPGEEYYWNDVGTPEMLRKAAKDILEGGNAVKGINVPYVKITERETKFGGTLKNCLIPAHIDQPPIYGTAEDSIIGPHTTIDTDATVRDSILMGNNQIKARPDKPVTIQKSIIGKYGRVSHTSLIDVVAGRQVILHGCDVDPGVRITADAQLFEENVTADIRREDREW